MRYEREENDVRGGVLDCAVDLGGSASLLPSRTSATSHRRLSLSLQHCMHATEDSNVVVDYFGVRRGPRGISVPCLANHSSSNARRPCQCLRMVMLLAIASSIRTICLCSTMSRLFSSKTTRRPCTVRRTDHDGSRAVYKGGNFISIYES